MSMRVMIRPSHGSTVRSAVACAPTRDPARQSTTSVIHECLRQSIWRENAQAEPSACGSTLRWCFSLAPGAECRRATPVLWWHRDKAGRAAPRRTTPPPSRPATASRAAPSQIVDSQRFPTTAAERHRVRIVARTRLRICFSRARAMVRSLLLRVPRIPQ
jgi:hypothetical protein